MAKKQHVDLSRSDEMTDIDDELDNAMRNLDDKNVQIDHVLENYEPRSIADGAEEGAEDEDQGASNDAEPATPPANES